MTLATFSSCRTYRYTLSRSWAAGPVVAFIGLNPSTADETTDDPTIRRCIGFARSWGFGGLLMLNLFAFRATDPKVMRAAPEPVGPGNNLALTDGANAASLVVAAWGTHGTHRARDAEVRKLLTNRLHYLRLTKKGHPEHPLYLPASLTPQPWSDR